jgi:D-glycero-D-manno-heptose 1,7-bisphosphate phosphatase
VNRSRSFYYSEQQHPTGVSSHQRTGLRRAVFLDRDGTLNMERGYLTDPAELVLYHGAGLAVRQLNSNGWLVVVLTNQSAIGRGLLSVERLEQVQSVLRQELAKADAFYDAFYYCPHIPKDNCDCRKPKPGLLLQAAVDLSIDLSGSFMIGDKLSDIEAGHLAGCKSILVLTGQGKKNQKSKTGVLSVPDSIQDDVLSAVNWIKNNT